MANAQDALHPHDNCLESEDQIGEPYPKPRKDALQAAIERFGAVEVTPGFYAYFASWDGEWCVLSNGTSPGALYQIARMPTKATHGWDWTLKEYGAWDESELADDAKNRDRLLWIVAGNLRDERGW